MNRLRASVRQFSDSAAPELTHPRWKSCVRFDHHGQKAERFEDGNNHWVLIVYRPDGQWDGFYSSDGGCLQPIYSDTGDLLYVRDQDGVVWECVVRTHHRSIYHNVDKDLYRTYNAWGWRHEHRFDAPFEGAFAETLQYLLSRGDERGSTAYKHVERHRLALIKERARQQRTAWWRRCAQAVFAALFKQCR